LIVQILSFDVTAASPVLILAGFVMFRRPPSSRTHDLGRAFIGLGLVLLSLHQLVVFMQPYEAAPGLRKLLDLASSTPVLDVILAAILTWAAHSSVAVVLLIMSLASRGIVPMEAALALVLGANLGTAINPVLEGASGSTFSARRLPLGNLLNRTVGIAVALALLHPLSALIATFEPTGARAVANFHTLFNLAVAAVFLPLLQPYAKLLRRLIPDRVDPADPSRPLYLDASAREAPIVALGGAAREALRMADFLCEMLRGAQDALGKEDRRLIAETRRMDDILDRLNTAIKTYLISLDPDALNDDDQQRLEQILTFAMNIEQAGDVLDRNLLPHAAKRLKRGLVFSQEGSADLRQMMERLTANVQVAASLLMTGDQRAARILAEEKAAFRDAETAATAAHFARLRKGRIDTAETSSLHLDILRDIKQINSHIVAAAAYPVLTRTGELLPSRIASAS
jgi:phosphate:Na+ symporter